MTEYLPEGGIINSAANKAALQNISSLQEAYRNGSLLEARALVCNAAHDLYVLGYAARNERRGGADWRTSPKIIAENG